MRYGACVVKMIDDHTSFNWLAVHLVDLSPWLFQVRLGQRPGGRVCPCRRSCRYSFGGKLQCEVSVADGSCLEHRLEKPVEDHARGS